jgi:WD40 repeat protein/tRNA A-37 threonylcarbamoyl transferase component Bud32
MDDTACFDEGPLEDRRSPAGSGSDRRTAAGRPDGAVLGPRGATVASQGLDRPVPDAGAHVAAPSTCGATVPASATIASDAPSAAAVSARDDAGPSDPVASAAVEPTFGPPPDPHAATGASDAPPEGTHRTAPAIPGYEIVGELGRGGMGVVYHARQTRLNRPVALKMILAGAHAGAEAAARFLAEAEAVAQLQHPNIVQIFHIDEHAGFPYFEMEFVGGGSLADRLDGTPRPPREAARLTEILARAMAEAHRRGIVHRDLKPGNILLTPEGAPKVADFGLAKLLNAESGLTRTDSVLGSPSYMAPEQAEGKTKDVGPAADVYALGAILYELLTGRPPYRGATVLETLEQVKTTEPVPPSRLVPGLPRDAETIALKCLQKDPSRRYDSAAALAEDLRRYRAGEPIVARPVGRMERAWRWCRRNPVVAGLTAAVLLLFAAGFAGVTWNYWRAEAARRELERTLYFQRIALAHRELTANFTNPARAEELLEACPPQRRGWEWSYLKRLWQVDPVVLRDPGNPVVYSVALSPDGEHVAAACRDATVKVRDLRTGQVVTLRGHEKSVFGVAFSPTNGRLLASAGDDGTVRVWDWTTRQELYSPLPGREAIPVGMAQSVAFSPDGRWLAAASDRGTVRVWDWTTRQELYSPLPDHELRVCVAFSPDSRLLASGNGYGIVQIWDARAGRRLAKLGGHIHSVGGLAFSPDGRRLAAGYFDRLIDIWDPTTGKRLHSLSGHTGLVLGLAFSRDGRLASSSEDRTVRLWDLPTGQEVLLLRGHTDACQGLAFSPDGRLLASASRDRTIRLWDATPLTVNEGQERLTFREHTNEVWNVAISPNGTQIASAGLDPTVYVWDATTGQVAWTSTEITSAVFGVAFSPDGRLLAAVGAQASGPKPFVVKVWDAHTGQEALTIPAPPKAIFTVGFSPDGRWLALGSNDGTVRLWDAGTGHEIGLVGQHAYEVRGLAFRHDGRRLASASSDGTVKIWDMTPGHASLQTLQRSDAAVWGVAFHPDGRRLVTVSSDDQLTLWDAEAGQPIRQVGGQFSGQGLSVAFSPNGRWVACSAQDCTVKAWDATTLELLHTFRGHRGPIRCLAVSGDGKFLVTGSADQTVKVWDLTRLDTKLK